MHAVVPARPELAHERGASLAQVRQQLATHGAALHVVVTTMVMTSHGLLLGIRLLV